MDLVANFFERLSSFRFVMNYISPFIASRELLYFFFQSARGAGPAWGPGVVVSLLLLVGE